MANHKSSIKRIRQSEKKQGHNKYFAKTTRNAIKKLKSTTEQKEASELLPSVTAMVDKLAKKNIIHKNKATHLKSQMTKHVNALA
ncbi:MAG: 30S ribosomal protein S20 [Bacteroidales bacterium]|jgi:small subunit ribosomal protein S20|nr:30S ribosomal protein S20 [Bacteroidales bacterium]